MNVGDLLAFFDVDQSLRLIHVLHLAERCLILQLQLVVFADLHLLDGIACSDRSTVPVGLPVFLLTHVAR